jgi:hypothetical protein
VSKHVAEIAMRFLELHTVVRCQINQHQFGSLVMHRQRSRLVTLAGLISIGLGSAGFAVSHGANGGSAGHGAGFYGSSSGHGHGHHRGGSHGGRGSGGGGYRGDHGGWSIPGHGFYFASIPSYCKLVYWEGLPYYYADDVYYEWNGTAGAYEEVQPPAGLAEQIDAQVPVETELFVFPNGDQTNEQLERDREACHRWAVEQVGFDPNAAAPRAKALDRSAAKRANYLRADEACLEARDYSVE